jgi:hypothetical protein
MKVLSEERKVVKEDDGHSVSGGSWNDQALPNLGVDEESVVSRFDMVPEKGLEACVLLRHDHLLSLPRRTIAENKSNANEPRAGVASMLAMSTNSPSSREIGPKRDIGFPMLVRTAID